MASYLDWKGYSSDAPTPAAKSSPDQPRIGRDDDDDYSVSEVQMEEVGADEILAIQIRREKAQSLRNTKPTWSRKQKPAEAPIEQYESLEKNAAVEHRPRRSKGLLGAIWGKTSNLGFARRNKDGQSPSANKPTAKSKELEREAVTPRPADPEEVDIVEVVSIRRSRKFRADLWLSPQSGSHFSVRNCSGIDVFVTMCENRPRRMLSPINIDVSAAGGGGGIGLSPYNVPPQILCLVHDKDHKEHLESKKPQDSCPAVCFSWPKNKDALLSVEHDGKVYIGNIPVPSGAIIELQEKFKLRIFAKRK